MLTKYQVFISTKGKFTRSMNKLHICNSFITFFISSDSSFPINILNF